MYTRAKTKVSRAHLDREPHVRRRRSSPLRSGGSSLSRALTLATTALSIGSLLLLWLAPRQWLLALGGLGLAIAAISAASLLLAVQLLGWLLQRLHSTTAWLVTILVALPTAAVSLTLTRFAALMYSALLVVLWMVRRRRDRDRLPPAQKDGPPVLFVADHAA